MKLENAYFWPGEGRGVGLLVQEYHLKKEDSSLLAACLMKGEAAFCENFGQEFAALFHGDILSLCMEKGFEGAERPLREFLKRQLGKMEVQKKEPVQEAAWRRAYPKEELRGREKPAGNEAASAPASCCGIVSLDGDFLLFCKGEMRVGVLNLSFRGEHLRFLKLPRAGLVQRGLAESGTGIVFLTESLTEVLGTKVIEECLSVRELSGKAQAERRLAELAAEAAKRGREDVGAVLVLAEER